MGRTILNEENLKKILGPETIRLNIENHYWLKEQFVDKIGRMAVNLEDLCLRRLRISNRAFMEIFKHLKKLQKVDLASCKNLRADSLDVLFSNNKSINEI